MIDLRNLETFVWVARLGGFRLAAEKLNMTQPAISARIALLEEDLRLQLFETRPRRGVLTPSGQELLRYAERILALKDDMVRAVGGNTSYKVALKIGVPETIVHTWLAILVDTLSRNHPTLTLDVEVDSTTNLVLVSIHETNFGFSRREEFWFIVAARSEDETEVRAG